MSADQLFTTSDPMDAPNHVKPEAGRCDVCGLDADQCNGVPIDAIERMRVFIDAYAHHVGWTFAKTMADIPHSYAVRKKAAGFRSGEDEFVWFAEAIRQYGYKRSWTPRGKRFSYVNVDGWRYWTMGNPIPETTILNRAPLAREGREQLRRENGFHNTRWFECERGHRFGVVIETMTPVPAFGEGGGGYQCPGCTDTALRAVENDGGRQY